MNYYVIDVLTVEVVTHLESQHATEAILEAFSLGHPSRTVYSETGAWTVDPRIARKIAAYRKTIRSNHVG